MSQNIFFTRMQSLVQAFNQFYQQTWLLIEKRKKINPQFAEINLIPSYSFEQFTYFLKFQQTMGCQQSNLSQLDLNQNRIETLTTDQDVQLKPETIINRHRGDPHQIYHFSRVIWRGRSIIRKILDRTSRIERVCKILYATKNTNLFSSFHEVELLKKLNHPNIMQIVEYYSQPNFLYIILENIPGYTLHELYCRQEIRSLEVIIQIVKQILIALKFCHQKGIIHKALNPQHVMIVQLLQSRSYLVKLVGFGRALRNGAQRQLKNIVKQDPIFSPPELGSQLLADKQDIWACGVIFLQLISGQRKFQNFIQRINTIIQEVMNKQVMPQDQKVIISDFLKKMLSIQPKDRPSAEQALEHEIFRLSHKKTIFVQQNNSLVMNKLLKFRIQNNLKSLFFIYATLNILSVEEKSVYLRQFYNLDKNKDGKIDFDELVQGMQNTFQVDLETAIERINKIFELCKKQRGHFLQFHQYVAATSLVSKQIYQNKLVKLFDEIDTNKDGKITNEQLARAVEGVKSSHLLKNFEHQQITFSEFKELLLSIFKSESEKISND